MQARANLISPLSLDMKSNNGWLEYSGSGTLTIPSYRIKVEGLREYEEFYIVDTEESYQNPILTVTKDGIYTVPSMDYEDREYILYGYQCLYNDEDYKIVITILADYPDGLVFDGIDDYGICSNMPILTDYTVICKRTILEPVFGVNQVYSALGLSNKAGNSAYWLDFIRSTGVINEYSYGGDYTVTNFQKDGIIVMTKNSYNGNVFKSGTGVQANNILLIGSLLTTSYFIKNVTYDYILYDRTLTPEEIQSEILKYKL